MEEGEGSALRGGAQTEGVVRLGETVRRPLHRRSEYVHALIEHLEATGFGGAPRVLGIDERGREVLTYIPGEVVLAVPARLSDARLVSATRLLRRFHDATAGTPLAATGEVVCHGDVGPHNIVFAGEDAVALIDWDEDVAAGPRLLDLAHAAWCCADLGDDEVEVPEQARKLRLLCEAYGWKDEAAVVGELRARFCRARDQHTAAGRGEAVTVFAARIEWMERNGPALAAAL